MRRRTILSGLVVLVAACTPSGDDDRSGAATTTAAPAVTEPTTTTTEAPLSGLLPVVVEQGFSVFPDPIDPTADLGGFGAVIENPNPDVLAAGVSVTVRLLDEAGDELLSDTAILNGILPGRRMAVGRTLIEPIDEPAGIEVTVDVAVYLLPAAEGDLEAVGVETVPVEGGGFATTFTASSTWPTDEEGVDAAAVYRATDGRILAVERTTLARLPAGGETTGTIRLLAPIPDLDRTEVFVGRGFAAQSVG